MAAVTKNLAFGITASTSFEPPFLLAKRFSSLDHFTNGRIGWNIVTGWKKSAFKAIGTFFYFSSCFSYVRTNKKLTPANFHIIGYDSPIDHDERYVQADEYLRVLYK